MSHCIMKDYFFILSLALKLTLSNYFKWEKCESLYHKNRKYKREEYHSESEMNE